MQNRLIPYMGTLVLFFGFFYTMSHLGITYKSHHPAINETASDPELYFSNVRHYAKDRMFDRSLIHLEQAINSIRNLEMDFDDESIAKVEKAITRLELIYDEILLDSLITEDMYEAFEYTLNTLAMAELKVSEKYAESNSPELAVAALKYAHLHLKTASNYSKGINMENERLLYHEIDSIINAENVEPERIVARIDHVLEQMNSLVE